MHPYCTVMQNNGRRARRMPMPGPRQWLAPALPGMGVHPNHRTTSGLAGGRVHPNHRTKSGLAGGHPHGRDHRNSPRLSVVRRRILPVRHAALARGETADISGPFPQTMALIAQVVAIAELGTVDNSREDQLRHQRDEAVATAGAATAVDGAATTAMAVAAALAATAAAVAATRNWRQCCCRCRRRRGC